MNSFYDQLINEFNIQKENIGNCNSDFYVLPRNSTEFVQIVNFIKKKNQEYTVSLSDVQGQTWYGKYFIKIFFAYQPYWDEKNEKVFYEILGAA